MFFSVAVINTSFLMKHSFRQNRDNLYTQGWSVVLCPSSTPLYWKMLIFCSAPISLFPIIIYMGSTRAVYLLARPFEVSLSAADRRRW